MIDPSEKDSNLADNLFGPKPFLTEKLMGALTGDLNIDDDKPWPVKVNSYIDPETHRLRYQLDSRGIMRTEDTSRYNDHGINKIDQTTFEEFDKSATSEKAQEKVFSLKQADLDVDVKAILVDDGRIAVKANLLPNSHGIIQKSTRYYLIEKDKLYRVFTDPYPNSDPTNIFGVYFNYAISCVIIDLIND